MPMRARFGVSFVSSKSDPCCTLFMEVMYAIYIMNSIFQSQNTLILSTQGPQ